jgi:Na+/H+ antiporter NhaD/arsenite permease-like protein
LKLTLRVATGLVGLLLLFTGIFWTHFWPNTVAGAALAGAAIVALVDQIHRKRRRNGDASFS